MTLFCLVAAGCTPSVPQKSVSVSLNIPGASHILGAVPAHRLICFAANLNAPGSTGCGPGLGIVHSEKFSQDGSLTFGAHTFDRGTSLTIDLYMYLGAAGELACPEFSVRGLTPEVLQKTYAVGTATARVNPVGSESLMSFDMTAEFPGETKSYFREAAACAAVAPIKAVSR